MNFLPPTFKTSKRTFLGNLFGGKKGGDSGAGLSNPFSGMPGMPGMPGMAGGMAGMGQMMEMMEMMQMMQKVTGMVKNGKPSEKDYDEICGYIEKLRKQQGGKLTPEIDALLTKIQSRQPIAQDEVMVLLGINQEEASEIRTMTVGVKNGTVNQMTYMMKVAEIFQRAQQRKEAAAPKETTPIEQIKQ